jgi:hypothetical protein
MVETTFSKGTRGGTVAILFYLWFGLDVVDEMMFSTDLNTENMLLL